MLVKIVATVADGERRIQSLRALLSTVQRLNESFLRAHPEVPDLYASGVIYQREPRDRREEFCTIPACLEQGWGDCDDLAPWRAAELRVRKRVDARAVMILVRPGLYHCLVQLPSGRVEDPSRRLGMSGAG